MNTRKGFSLLELIVVMSIMTFMGTVSVAGYRAMRQGMEERSAISNVKRFLQSAYQRAQIDRQPVCVYYWNETLRSETDYAPPIVVGKMVAVKRTGRFSKADSTYLYDEFCDFVAENTADDEEEISTSRQSAGMFVYKMNGDEESSMRSTVSVDQQLINRSIGTIVHKSPSDTANNTDETEMLSCYVYEILDSNGVTWKAGDAYGVEFASLQLAHGYLAGSEWKPTKGDVSNAKLIRFGVGKNSGNGSDGKVVGSLQLCSLRPGSGGSLTPDTITTFNQAQITNDEANR